MKVSPRPLDLPAALDAAAAVRALTALAHPTRLEVFRLLVRSGPDGLAAGAVAEQLQLRSTTLSFHLRELKLAEVVSCRRDGRSLIYAPQFQVMAGLLDYLCQNCCQGVACEPMAEAAGR